MANSVGPPTKYKVEYNDLVYKLALLGSKDKEIANVLDISEATLNTWKNEHPQLLESLRNGKEKADAEIANSLRKRAEGYEYTEMQAIKVKEVLYENGKRLKETERIEMVPVKRVQPPDTSASIFWLKNRKSKVWRDKHELEHTGDSNPLRTVTNEDLDERIRRYTEQRRTDSPT